MSGSGHVSKVRTLYKRILVLHRFMPIHLRALGDQYVKEEFRRHKNASPQQANNFMTEWQKYKDNLQSQILDASGSKGGSLSLGVNMSEKELNDFRQEQIGQLYELLLESTKPNSQFHIQEDKS
ncbi:succinate dehydrogenase assembly factor 3, mitochondrial [Nerophis lumbriciformis]|uniref:succinate dehydrogenase assembly factor 3, mitochondrial n=1 Tax=Nerophis lumbriciformis TaxID=546530 RepID=UPI002ADF966D|nr:succinate dehydrogenase assembly factor 3, mitochondrial-like [Nerophis lumbriciformis]